MRVLFTCVALPGHLFPLVPLAWAYRALGHDVLVATSENFVPTVLRAGLPATACGPAAGVGDLAAAGVVDPISERGSAHRSTAQRYAHGLAFGGIAKRNLPGIRSIVDSWRPDLVISERAEFAAPVAAVARGIPRVELHWGVAPLVEYLPAVAEVLATELAPLGLTAPPAPDAVLDPWPPSMRLAHAAGHLTMRHVPYNGDALVPDWLLRPGDRPRVCLTLGTVLPHLGPDGVADIVLPLLDRLADLGCELLVAVDDRVAATWPALPDAVRFAGRLPLSHVLAACDVSINHGGQGTALTGVGAGCPQLLLPQFDDQFDNADAVVRAGAGIRLPAGEITPDAVARACVRLLEVPGYRRAAAAVSAELAALPAATDVIEYLAGLTTPTELAA